MELWYSTNEEGFDYQCIEDAADYVISNGGYKPGDTFEIWSGTPNKLKASDLFRWDPDDLGEAGYEECGEYAIGYPGVNQDTNKELLDELKAIIDKWADKHDAHPSFATVDNVKTVTIRCTSEDGDFEVVSA